ncbi:hypothetical protein CHU92_13065 [Flavobacterium cyanobacteriorum]|uniref:N-acetyltransferase domain-containing protein n=1 Tax=Flavobacterium cyanobacteriorum TaxID=2022802 RepID=A0A255YVP0_9FLAO|nr:GNAT family N-acetyltransferase [Flavobacterium cyanobacteriorum]OYQ33316.1 hypothetical protein CHU92_13065 [Flavobacterium cyanobacteriorum]
MLKHLDWDTKFFGRTIGELVAPENSYEVRGYDLIYVKTEADSVDIKGFTNKYKEKKLVFFKKLQAKHEGVNNIRPIISKEYLQELYLIAFESGKHSRFKMDSNLNIFFEPLYREWVDKSFSRSIADDVLGYFSGDKLAGMVTYRSSADAATIGLIGVLPQYQGQGIGKQLLAYVENELLQKRIYKLYIPTQESNSAACNFYICQGYSVAEKINIMHYYKNDTI